ncbi:YjcB family protein [Sodalis sp. RH21]|uniref:YjcB family protein n=1 Tax=unclassified Sodalis (in: enterobacteria) TaxID=2636512 RepID=UPI0039B48DCF
MGTLTAGFVLMRWELLSAVMMFFASTLNVICRNHSRNALAFIFSGVGISMACWFVTGLLGITLSFEISWREAWSDLKEVMMFVISHTPPDWQIT